MSFAHQLSTHINSHVLVISVTPPSLCLLVHIILTDASNQLHHSVTPCLKQHRFSPSPLQLPIYLQWFSTLLLSALTPAIVLIDHMSILTVRETAFPMALSTTPLPITFAPHSDHSQCQQSSSRITIIRLPLLQCTMNS